MIDSDEQVVLVDRQDREMGLAPKLAAHRDGRLHRALSVVVRDPAGRFLLQKRQLGKYHSGGLWTNSCCSHPRPGESVETAARRRLGEEMGFECPLVHLLTTYYRAELDKGMIEHEIVHVFGGVFSGAIRPDPEQVDGFAWVAPDELVADVAARPQRYSVWFRKYLAENWRQLTAEETWARLAPVS